MADSKEVRDEGWVQDFIFVCFSRFGFFLALHQMQPVFPLYLEKLGASSTIIGATFAAFTITATVTRPPVGLLIDRFGRKPFLLLGIVLFSVASLGYLWARSILLIVFFRILHGIGWSGCTTAISTLTADIAPERRRGELIGYASMANNLAAALGPIVGFAIFYRFGYDGTFLATFIICLSSLLAASRIREPKLLASELRVRKSWIETLAVLETLLPATTIGFLSFCLGGVVTFLPLYALERGLRNPGIWFTVYAVCLLISRPIAGPLSDRISRRAVILPGFILSLSGMILLALARSPVWLILAAIIMGLGFGAAQPALMTLAVDQTSPQRRGLSIAQYQLFFDLGIGLGSVALGALLDVVDRNFSTMYLAATAVGAVGLAIYWLRS